MKAVVFALAVALAALPVVGGACGKAGSPVKVSISEIALAEVSYSMIVVEVTVQIVNGGDSPAVMDRIEYDIYFGHKDKWIWLGRGSETQREIGAGQTMGFTIQTQIDNSRLIRLVTEAIFGTEPSQLKVDGRASFTRGTSAFQVRFDKKMTSPSSPGEQSANPLLRGREG